MSDKISKYFVPKDGPGSNKEGNQSMDDDFKTPKRMNTKSNIKLTKKVKEKKSKKGVDKSQLRLTKIAKQNSPLEVNPEHWQLAIALSKSLQKPEDDDVSCSEYPSTQQKITSLKENLQQFGFKSGPTLEVQKRRPPVEKKKKKSKFQYVTPVLLLRKQEDRVQMIAEKISMILSERTENCLDYLMISAPKRRKPFSRNLQELWKSDKKIYDIHGFGLDLLKNSNLFYVEELNFDTDKLKCGDLLKNWSDIPGRDISPVRNLCFDELSFISSQKDKVATQNVVKTPKRSITPELFDSDDELFIPPKVPNFSSPREQEVFEDVSNTLDSSTICPSFPINNLDAFSESSEFSENKAKFGFGTKSLVQSTDFDSEVFGNANEISYSPPFPSTQSDDTIIQQTSYSELLKLTPQNDFKNSKFLSPKKVLIENDNGICVFESFSKEANEISDSIDLTLSSDEEDNKNPVPSTSFIFESPVSRSPKKLVRKSNSFSFGNKSSERIRRSNSLNVTDYVNGLLHKDWKSVGEIYESDAITANLTKSPMKRSCSTSSSTSLGSQKSYYISDEELNYSCRFGEFELQQNFDLSDHEENMEANSISMPGSFREEKVFITPKHQRVKDLSHETQSKQSSFQSDQEIGTPTNNVIVKTENVTPVLNYEEFNTPALHRELSKFGLKPMKRQRGVQILKHLYESTHPFVDSALDALENSESDKEDTKVIKKRKYEDGEKESPKKSLQDQIEKCGKQNIEIVGNLISECDTDLIFEKKRSSKILSCQLPLHIAWYNLVTSHPQLQRKILLYEPIHLEVVYNMLKEQGHVYHIQDIMTFLDKNCVNIKIEQSTSRGQHKRKKDKPSKKS